MAGGQQQYTFDRVVRMALTAIGLVALFFLLRYLSDVLLPFVVAVILAYLLNPVVTALETKTGRRGVAVGLTLMGLFLVAFAAVAVLIPLVDSQIGRFAVSLEKLRSDLTEAVSAQATKLADAPSTGEERDGEESALGWSQLRAGWREFRDPTSERTRAERLAALRQKVSGTIVGRVLDDAIEFIQSDAFRDMVVNALKRIAAGGWTVVSFAVSFLFALTGLVIVLIYLVFLLLDYPEYARLTRDLLPPDYKEALLEFTGQFTAVMGRCFRGQSLVALSVGTLSALGFTIVGLPMAVPFGLFVGLLNMVPYLQAVAIPPALVLAALQALEGDTSFLWAVASTLLIFAIVQLLQDAILVPRIMGNVTGLRPVMVLLGVFIWGKLLGLLGLLLAIPLTCLGIAYYRRFVLQRSVSSRPMQEAR